jgi:hypothetical protein
VAPAVEGALSLERYGRRRAGLCERSLERPFDDALHGNLAREWRELVVGTQQSLLRLTSFAAMPLEVGLQINSTAKAAMSDRLDRLPRSQMRVCRTRKRRISAR